MRPLHTVETIVCVIAGAVYGALPLRGAADDVIEDILVTATRIPRSIEDIAGTVSVIGSEELERQIADDLDDLVRYQPGVSMDTVGRGGNQGFIIRGIGGNRVLTLIDGVRANDSYDAVVSGYGKDVFEIDDLKSVQIIRGPASVLYGADAMGGAVILETKDLQDYLEDGENKYLGARVAGSSTDEQYKLGLSGGTEADNWSTLFQYTRREFAEREVNDDVALNPLDGRSDGLIVKTMLMPNEHQELELVLDAFSENIESRLDTDVGASVTSSLGDDETDRHRISLDHRWHGDARLADEVDTQVFWQTTDALQHTEQNRTSYSFIDPTDFSTYGGTTAERTSDFEFNQEIRGLGVTLRKEVATGEVDHSIVYGLSIDETETERPRSRCETESATGASTCSIAAYPFADPEVFPNRTFPDTSTTRGGVFAQDEMILANGKVTLIPGIRYDRYEMDPSSSQLVDVGAFGFEVVPVDEHNVSANLGFIYDLTERLALFAQYAEGFRPPNFEEANQAFVNRAFGYATVPNPDLRPESSKGLEVGLKASRERSRFSVSLYQNRYTDFIDTQFAGLQDGISLFQQRNIGEAEIGGLELTALWMLSDRWRLHGALAYARGDDRENDVPLDSVDPLTSVLGVGFAEPNDRWSIETLLTLVADKDRVSAEDRVTASAYGVVDLIGHYRITSRSTLRMGVYNVFDETYARWANIQGLPGSDAETIARAQNPGTNLRMSFNVDF